MSIKSIDIGFDVIEVEGLTGLYDTNYKGIAESILSHIKNYDLIYIHLEGIDEASHQGDLNLKIKSGFLEFN